MIFEAIKLFGLLRSDVCRPGREGLSVFLDALGNLGDGLQARVLTEQAGSFAEAVVIKDAVLVSLTQDVAILAWPFVLQ